jgi:hypothetical protein
MFTTEKTKTTTPIRLGESGRLLKRIGSTNYVVFVHFGNKNSEKLEEKILRLIESEVKKRA